MKQALKSAALFPLVTSVLSVLLSTIIVVVRGAEAWFNVHMAVLSPVIACFCYGDSLIAVYRKAFGNLTGVLCGGLLALVWVIILRLIAYAMVGSMNYNAYYATILSVPWLLLFRGFTPSKLVSQECLCLLFLSITMYSGDFDTPDAFPLRAILSGTMGCLIPCLVGTCVALLLSKAGPVDPFIGFNPALFEINIQAYFDSIVDELILTSPNTQIMERNKRQCINAIYTSSAPDTVRESMLACVAQLVILQQISAVRGDGLAPHLVANLVALKSSRRGIDYSPPVFSPDALTHESPLRASAALPIISLYFHNLSQYLSKREEIYVRKISAFFRTLVGEYKLNDSPFLPPSWVALRDPKTRTYSILDLVRFSLVFAALGLLLVLWDARDQTVDTYALWSFLPAFILYEKIDSLGSAIVDGGTHLGAAAFGGSLGLLCLLLNDASGPMSALTEFAITLLLGFGLQYATNKRWGNLGIVFTVTWIECVLGNFGYDPTDSGNGYNSLWRVALYRMTIPCFAVFVVALSFLIIPTVRQSNLLRAEIQKFLESIPDESCMQSIVCDFKRKKVRTKVELLNRKNVPKISENLMIDFVLLGICSIKIHTTEDVSELSSCAASVLSELAIMRKAGIRESLSSSGIVTRTRELKQCLARAVRKSNDISPDSVEKIIHAIILMEFMRVWLKVARATFEAEFDVFATIDTTANTRFNSNIEDQVTV